MLKESYEIEPTEIDLVIYEKLVPSDHYLRQVKEVIDFEAFREKVSDCYSADQGSPAYDLSDREVIGRAQVDIACRLFLDLSLECRLPVPSLLSQFRTRLGEERHQVLFDEIINQAREKGLVKDRLRLKDATHVIANVAIPTTIALVAQAREGLLATLEELVPEPVASEREEVTRIRQTTVDLGDEERLLQRVTYLRGLVSWTEELVSQQSVIATWPETARNHLVQALAIAHKLLGDQDDPEGSDRLRSVVDEDVRRGKHGDFFDGYLIDVAIDADSELLTGLNLLPANGDEGADAVTLIETEQATHDNRIEALSIDGVGFQGPLLRTLTDPEGLDLRVYVPPHSQGISESPYYTTDEFDLNEAGTTLTCPAGEQTDRRYRNRHDTGWVFYFRQTQCRGCSRLDKCMEHLPQKHGRTVSKNDYHLEYQTARQVAQTPAYAQVRKEHPKVERKLAEIVRYHHGRRARYWGLARNKTQYLLTGMVVNIKRIVRLLNQQAPSPSAPNPG